MPSPPMETTQGSTVRAAATSAKAPVAEADPAFLDNPGPLDADPA
jgi:hypothetical protein